MSAPNASGSPPAVSIIFVSIFRNCVPVSIAPPNKSVFKNVDDKVWKLLVKPSIFNIFNEDRNSSPVVSYINTYINYATSLNFHFSFLDDFTSPLATRYISCRLDTESFSASYIVLYEQI